MGEECFGNLVVAGMESPMVKASFTGKAKTAFTWTAQQKRAAKAVRDKAAPRWAVQLAGRGHPGPGCGGVHHPLPPVWAMRPGPSGGTSPPGALSVRTGHAVHRLDGRKALPHQNAGLRRGLLRLLYLQKGFQMGQRTESGLLMEKQICLVSPSRTYRTRSACVQLLDLGGLKRVKRTMYQDFAHPHNRETLPRWIYRRFSVEKTGFQGYPADTLTAEHSQRDKTPLFLHSDGGRMRPTTLHYHTIAWLLRHTDHGVVLPSYPLALRANAAQARE